MLLPPELPKGVRPAFVLRKRKRAVSSLLAASLPFVISQIDFSPHPRIVKLECECSPASKTEVVHESSSSPVGKSLLCLLSACSRALGLPKVSRPAIVVFAFLFCRCPRTGRVQCPGPRPGKRARAATAAARRPS